MSRHISGVDAVAKRKYRSACSECMRTIERGRPYLRVLPGRLKFGNASACAPFPSAIVVFDGYGLG